MSVADYVEEIRRQILDTPHVVSHSLGYEDRPPLGAIVNGSVTSPHTLTIGILPTESFFHLLPLRSSPLCKKRQLASSVTPNSRSPTRSEKPTHQTTDLKPGDWSTVYGGACSAIPPRQTTVRGSRFPDLRTPTFSLQPLPLTPLLPTPTIPHSPFIIPNSVSRITPHA